MNKRFSTMMVALMAIGSMLGTALAADVTPTLGTAIPVAVDQVKSGHTYFIVQSATAPTKFVDDADFFMVNAEGANTHANVAVDAAGAFTTEAAVAGARWTVTVNGDGEYTFTNADVKLAFTALGALSDGGVVNKFVYDGDKKAFVALGDLTTPANKYLKIATGNGTSLAAVDATTQTIHFYEVPATTVASSDINSEYGAGFSLNFGDLANLSGNEAFGKVTVVTSAVSGKNTGVGEVMLMVSGNPTAGATPTFANDPAGIAAFNAAKFVVLSTEATDNLSVDYAAGEGYTYKVVSGKDILADASADKGAKVAFSNAKFKITEQVNHDGWILTQTGVKLPETKGAEKLAEKAGNIRVSLFAAGAQNYVVSKVDASYGTDADWSVIKPALGTIANVKDIVKGKMLVNVLIANASGDFHDALLLNATLDGAAVTTDGAKSALLRLPVGQWVVSAAANGANTITLTNRTVAVSEAGLTLTKVDGKSDVFVAKGGTALVGGKTIKLVPVTADMFNGFLNLSDAELAGNNYNIAAIATLAGVDVETYVKVNGANAALTTKQEEATAWTLTKGDTVYVETAYNYYGADGKIVKDQKDSIAVVNYQLTSDGTNYVQNDDWSVADDADRNIFFRQVGNNKYLAFTGGDAAAFVSNIAGVAKYAKVDATAGKLAATSAAITEATELAIIPVDQAPSMKPTTEYATFAVDGANYLAMDKNLNGVVANETSVLKSATIEDFKFKVDSVNTNEITPKFFLSTKGMMMYNSADSVAKYTEGAFYEDAKELAKYQYAGANRIKFQEATRLAKADSLVIGTDTIAAGNSFKFAILEDGNGGYILKNGTQYVQNVNGQLVLTSNIAQAVSTTIAETEAPVANEGITTSAVKVTTIEGQVIIAGAQGKTVTISNVLGQTIANTVLSSDNVTISAPAGVVVVAIEGEAAVKAIVK